MSQAETGGQYAASQPFFQRAAQPGGTIENGSNNGVNGSDDILEEQLFYLASITHSIPDAVVAMDNDYCIRSWNEAAETLFGWKREEVLGKLAFDILPTTFPYNARGRVEWQVALATEGHWQGEIIQKHRNGTSLDILTSLSLLRDRAGTRIGLVAFHRDITERRQAEERARFLSEASKIFASSLDYQTTLSNIAHLVVPTLADWCVIDILHQDGKTALFEIVHKDPEKVQWARLLREQYPVDMNAPIGIPNVIRTGQPEFIPEMTDEMLSMIARSEERLNILHAVGCTSLMVIPLVAGGRVIGTMSFVCAESGRRFGDADLNLAEEIALRAGVAIDHARVYEKVQEARDQLNVILQSVADGIIVQDANGAIVYTNDIVARLTGFSSATTMLNTPAETMGNLLDNFHMKDEAGNFIPDEQLPGRRALRGEKHVQAMVQYEDEFGQKRWQLMRAEPILDDSGQVQFAVTVLTDISGQKEMERRKDEFINMVSHELKTPVTSIKGFAQLLQRRLSHHEGEESQLFLARMDTQLNRLTKLINNLLEISRLQTGRISYKIEVFDLCEVVSAAVENMQETVTSHHLLLESIAHAQVSGDKDRLDQVLTNLLSNAIKYSPHDSQVIVRMAVDNREVIVSVRDAGIGIAEAHHEKIFERFYQISNLQEKPFSGLGIGLYLSSEVVKRHGGRIWVESQKGEGATFYVALPLAAS